MSKRYQDKIYDSVNIEYSCLTLFGDFVSPFDKLNCQVLDNQRNGLET